MENGNNAWLFYRVMSHLVQLGFDKLTEKLSTSTDTLVRFTI